MQTPAQGKPAASAPLYYTTPAVPIANGTLAQVVAMQRYHNPQMPALVGICSQPCEGAALYGYSLFEPHAARELAAQLIRAAEIAERHNLDADRHAERRALAAAISPQAVERAATESVEVPQ